MTLDDKVLRETFREFFGPEHEGDGVQEGGQMPLPGLMSVPKILELDTEFGEDFLKQLVLLEKQHRQRLMHENSWRKRILEWAGFHAPGFKGKCMPIEEVGLEVEAEPHEYL